MHAGLPRLRQRQLHLATVDLLLTADPPDLARIVHHAIQANDARTVVRFAPAAGREAAAAGSHRQALEHFAAALHHSELLPVSERARVLDEHAWELYNAHEFPAAVRDSTDAVNLFETLGDPVRHGEALVRLSRHHFMAGDTDSALRASAGAVAVLEPTDRPASTAYALTNLGSLLALGEDAAAASVVLAKAQQLATELNRLDLVALSLNYQSIAVADLADQERIDLVTRSLQMALRQRHHEHAARGYTNLAELLFRYGRIDELERCVDDGLAFVTEHGFRSHAYNLEVHRCLVWMRRGHWAAAENGLLALVDQFDDPGMLEVYSAPVLARLRMRRGELAVGDDLQRLWRQALRRRSLLGLAFAGTALMEWAWFVERPQVAAQLLTEWQPHATRPGAGPVTAELLRYARRLEVSGSVASDQLPQPWAAGLRGDWRAAPRGWEQLGDPYEQALELAESGDTEQTLVALRMLDGLGAATPARLVRDRLRRLGLRTVPRGPQSRTRANPAGLTGRQLDVLALVAQDLTNAQIAAELVLSVRTVDHHVATILTKLGVTSRREAAAALASLG